MRGKLRDKPAEIKRGNLKRESLERRRPAKRENRNMFWLNQQLDQEDYPVHEDGEILLEKTQK